MITFCSLAVYGQGDKEKWVDSVFQTLSLNEKLGQLFFTRVSSHVQPEIREIIEKRIESNKLGGVIFTTGSVEAQARFTNRLQREAQVPLLISQDLSSGIGQLLDSAVTFPRPMAQGAMANDSLVYWLAREIARQAKVLGVHMSLSPNVNIIGSETFNEDLLYGDESSRVAKKSLLHMKGLQDEGLLSCGKYFPLKAIEVFDEKGKPHLKLFHDNMVSYPSLLLIEQGLDAIIPNTTDLARLFEARRPDLKKKLSDSTLQDYESGKLLHAPLGYSGVIMVDIQTMQTISEQNEAGDAELFAFEAGADMIITENDLDPAWRKIKKLIRSEKQYEGRLDERVKKLLRLKYDAGLWKEQIIDGDFLEANLANTRSRLMKMQADKALITTLINTDTLLPVTMIEDKTFACVITGDSIKGNIFHRAVKKYIRADQNFLNETDTNTQFRADILIIALFPKTSENVLKKILSLQDSLKTGQKLIIADFGCKSLKNYTSRFPVIVTGYADDEDIIGLVPQVIFGGLPSTGILPVGYGNKLSGTSVRTAFADRLAYSFPEEAGMDGVTLSKIERIADEAISAGSTPGCHVLVAKDGKVIYDKSFGHLTYDKKIPVTDETIYDLASLTKVSATLQAVMFLQEKHLIDIHKKISVYMPELKATNKKDITIIDMLTHQAGLTPFIPLWPLTLEGADYLPVYYNSQQSVGYPLQITPKLFGSTILQDSVYSWISHSKMLEKPPRTPYSYRYSDLGFMMFKQLAERITNQPLEDFLQQNFYEPLGAYSLGFTPLNRFSPQLIAPTEMDTVFRHGLLVGTVHDERAAMLGGLSGHAGLFGTANDLSKLGQMLLQEGKYGGIRYYKPETVKLFTRKQFESSRRGLGWDKPVRSEWNSPTSVLASPSTFGHTGFTGTCLWVDPEFDLVYIFVSNRVFPDRSDKLIKANIRSRIQDVIYEAIFNYCKTAQGPDFDDQLYSEQ
jgi:CubicO group peptidase (beta-lactamase class C family)/beta-glucosidase-like glycosyl hydrolase